jgi:hypothetical protein
MMTIREKLPEIVGPVFATELDPGTAIRIFAEPSAA